MNESMNEIKDLKKVLNEKCGQTSVELILLIGSILVLSLISGTYMYGLNSSINNQFNTTMAQARDYLIFKIK